MSTLLVPVTTIEKIVPHTNSDNLEIAIVLGWQLVVRKGIYHEGQKVVYVPIDSILPLELSDALGVTQYLSKQRVRCAKLRGEPSFGLTITPDQEWEIGENVAEHYHIEKYEAPIRAGTSDAEADHPLFIKYTEIENMRNFPDIFEEGEEVVLTEKLHGCLFYKTKISMADGSRKKIVDVKKGEYVLGVDDNGKVVPSLVLNTFNNGKAEKWLTVSGKRVHAGPGHSTWNVHCTPNHQFWNPERKQYVAAEDIKPGEKVLLARKEINLTPIQEQVLIGKMLGDGCYHPTSYGAAGIDFTQKKEDLEYVLWTLRSLGDIACVNLGENVSGHGSEMIRANTTFHYAIAQLFKDWKEIGEQKCVPEWVADKLSPIFMAFWYMDDGSLSHQEDQEDRVNIAVCNFTKDDCSILQKGLARFDIQAQYYVSGNNHSRLRLNSDDAEKFFLLIAPYVPPCMQYKMPERYRGHLGWLPSSENVYKSQLVEQTVDSVKEYCGAEASSKWDLETETHNFFANYILVHNSNSRVAVIEHTLMAGSHSLRRKQPEDFAQNLYWYPLSLPSIQALLKEAETLARQVIVYGEIYGPGVQSLQYGLKTLGYRVFDILIDGKYLDWDDMCTLCALYGIETVPEIARIPYNLSAVKTLSEGRTTLMQKNAHMREGVVVKPVRERSNPKVGRVVLKYISDTYLFGEKSDYQEV